MSNIVVTRGYQTTDLWFGLKAVCYSAHPDHLLELTQRVRALMTSGSIVLPVPYDLRDPSFFFVDPEDEEEFKRLEIQKSAVLASQFGASDALQIFQEILLTTPSTPVRVKIKAANDLFEASIKRGVQLSQVLIKKKECGKFDVVFLNRSEELPPHPLYPDRRIVKLKGLSLNVQNFTEKSKTFLHRFFRTLEERNQEVSRVQFLRDLTILNGEKTPQGIEETPIFLGRSMLSKAYSEDNFYSWLLHDGAKTPLSTLANLLVRPLQGISFAIHHGAHFFGVSTENLLKHGDKVVVSELKRGFIAPSLKHRPSFAEILSFLERFFEHVPSIYLQEEPLEEGGTILEQNFKTQIKALYEIFQAAVIESEYNYNQASVDYKTCLLTLLKELQEEKERIHGMVIGILILRTLIRDFDPFQFFMFGSAQNCPPYIAEVDLERVDQAFKEGPLVEELKTLFEPSAIRALKRLLLQILDVNADEATSIDQIFSVYLNFLASTRS